MRRIVGVVVGITTLVLSACVPPTVSDPQPIGPHQRFSGLVNGSGDGAVVSTVCGGPMVAGRTGPIASGQTVAVVADPTGDGDTGSDSSSVFVQPMSNWFVAQLTTYDTPVALPTDVQVPCEGTGTITFHQCWGIIACRDGAPAVVKVRFVNIAD